MAMAPRWSTPIGKRRPRPMKPGSWNRSRLAEGGGVGSNQLMATGVPLMATGPSPLSWTTAPCMDSWPFACTWTSPSAVIPTLGALG